MKTYSLSPAHVDSRGAITDIAYRDPFDHAALVTSRAGSRRGDHYHRESTQTIVVLEGRLIALVQIGGAVTEHHLTTGDVMVNEPNEVHTFFAVEDSVFLVLTKGPRGGADYESDTYRVEPLRLHGAP